MTNHTKPSGALRSLRARNRSLVIDVLRHEGSASRAEIARRTGLSRAAISSLVADLQREGLVVEGRTGPAQPGAQGGRPGVLLSLEAPAGIDFASDHVDVAIDDLSSHVLADRRRDFAPDSAGSFVLDSAAEAVAVLLEEAGVDRAAVIAVGVSVPAPVDSTTGVAGASTTLPWAGARPAAELERRLGLPVEVDNDGNAAALGESTRGVARDAPDMAT